MGTDRKQLEKEALEAVLADDYYELCDSMDSTPDEELEKIISDAVNQSPGPSLG